MTEEQQEQEIQKELRELSRRRDALELAIEAVSGLAIKDATYLQVALASGSQPKPADIDAVLVAATKFDRFLDGKEAVFEMKVEFPVATKTTGGQS